MTCRVRTQSSSVRSILTRLQDFYYLLRSSRPYVTKTTRNNTAMIPANRRRPVQWTEELLAEHRIILLQCEAKLANLEDYLTQLRIIQDQHGPDYIVPKTLRSQHVDATSGTPKVSQEIPKMENRIRIRNEGIGFHEKMIELGEAALGYAVVYTPESTPE
ncbi:hypothetical protein CC79DRAFT_5914 [Sarocladium strictum]